MRPLPIVAAFALPARRHTFLLGPAGTQRVLALVCRMLEDAKLEVREMAATTLSGTVPLPPPGPPPPRPPRGAPCTSCPWTACHQAWSGAKACQCVVACWALTSRVPRPPGRARRRPQLCLARLRLFAPAPLPAWHASSHVCPAPWAS